jgi:uncharacterized protein YndB with AHSA1/START domain
MKVHAEREVAVPPEDVFAFLADLENHWELTAHWVEVRALDRNGGGPARGGRVRLHGPLGLRRTARTRLLELDAPARVAGTAEVGARTRALVAWDLEPRNGGGHTLVRVGTEIERLGPVDRVLWALVGRRVMTRGFPAVLARLDSALAPADSGSVASWPSRRTSLTTTRPAPRPVASPRSTASSSESC